MERARWISHCSFLCLQTTRPSPTYNYAHRQKRKQTLRKDEKEIERHPIKDTEKQSLSVKSINQSNRLDSVNIFPGKPPFWSYKTTLKQQSNGEKWDVGHLSAFGWAVLFNIKMAQTKSTKQLNQKHISILHLIFHRPTVVWLLFCSLKNGIPRKFACCVLS